MKVWLAVIIMAFIFVLAICGTSSAEDLDKNYTYDADFDNGALIGLEHNSTPDELQLSNSSQSAFSYIWVPNSNEGTVSKVDTRTGMEVARYRTGPKGNGNPSRTTVDLEGNCWLGNRQTGTAIKIGLLENGGYIDRNHDGVIETSRDLDGNGVITSDEMLAWGQDECVLYEVVLITGHEGTYTPGNYLGPYVNDNNNPGPRGIAVDSQNNVWIGTFGTMKYYHINGSSGQIMQVVDVSSANHTPYGAVIDQNGILWSSGAGGNNVLRLDPSTGSFKRINLKHFAYGLGLDRNNHLFVAGWDSSCFSRINIITGTVDWTKACPYQSRGVAVTDDGDVWIANSAAGTVTRYSNDGVFKATIIAGNTPTGVSVDSYGKVWVVDYGDEYIHRISPTRNETDSSGNIINGVELSKRIIGGTHYGYSDMTGVVSNTITTMKGTWTVIHDSGMDNTPWGFISWTGHEPENTSIRARVRSSNDKQNWSAWEDAVNGSVLNSILKGRYLQIETTLQRLQGNQSPVLYDLRVTALVADVELNMTVDKPTPHVGENVTLTLKATNNGPRDAMGIEIGISLPPNFNVSSPGQGYYQEGIWCLESLASGASALLTIQGMVTPAMAHQVMNCTAERVRQDEYDPTPDDTGASFYLPVADLEVNATVNEDTLNVGDTAVFTTTIHNNGPDPARGLQIEETSPSGFINLPLPLGNYQNGTWIIPLLESGATITMTSLGVVTEEMAQGNITNTINILQQEYDLTAVKKVENNIYVPLVDLEIVKTAYRDPVAVGGVALLNLTVQNHGPDTARGVVVEKPLPTGFIPGKPSQGIISGDWWLVGDLAPGESATLLLGHLVAAEGNITSYAEVRTRQHDPNKLNNRQILNITAQRRTTIPWTENPSGNPSNPSDLLLNFYNSHSKGTVPMQDTGIPLNIPNLAIVLVFCGAYVNKNGIPKNKPLFILLIVAAAFLLFGTAGAADSSQNYTTDLNFDEGNLTGVEHQMVHDQLQLPSTPDEPEFLWVPNTNEGTVSKVNSKTGAELARYRTGPLSYACPSRTAVDSEGNCWVANYQTGTLIKIGSNSSTQTSQDLDHNGLITGSELLDWGKDGNVLYEVVLIPGHEGTYTPGKYTGGYANNWANPGLLAVVLDSKGNLWVGCYGLEKYFCIDGATGQILKTIDVSSVGHTPYGAVIDQNGIIWSSGGQYNNALRLDTKTGSFTRINIPQWTYGLALDTNNHLFVTGYSSSLISRINTLTGQVEWTKTAPYGCRGAVITEDGDVWTANLESNTITRFSNDGILKATIYPGNGPSALSIDGEGKIWTVDQGDEYIHRIDPEINGVDLSKRIVSGTHVGYSTMTSRLSAIKFNQEGTWTVIQDGGNDSTLWGTVFWTSSEPAGTSIRVKVRSSNDKQNWSSWEDATNGGLLHLTPAGRYLQVESTLTSTIRNVSPVLYDLTVTPLSKNPLQPVNQSDLVLSINSDNYAPSTNDTIKIILNVGNNGPENATNVTVNYKLPFGLEYQSTNSSYDPANGKWTVGNVAVGTVAALEVQAKVLGSGSLVNTGSAAAAEIDPDLANNYANLTINILNTDGMPDVPSNLTFNGTAGLPPIDNIKDLIDLDVNTPDSTSGSGSSQTISGSTNPGGSLVQPDNQLARDIAGVRGSVSSGSVVIPEWNLDGSGSSGSSSTDNNNENEEWQSFLVKFAGEVLFYAALSAIPNEYLQQVGDAFLNSFEALGNIVRYFGYGRQVDQILQLWERSKSLLGSPVAGSFISRWSTLMDVLGPNLGGKLLENALLKFFPNSANEIKLLGDIVTTGEFVKDPFGTVHSVIDVIVSILSKNIPNPQDLEKFLTI